MNFFDRLRVEHDELATKLDKLSAFIQSDSFSLLIESQQLLLRKQLVAMQEYRDLLLIRIETMVHGTEVMKNENPGI
jgi:hypothetical protein